MILRGGGGGGGGGELVVGGGAWEEVHLVDVGPGVVGVEVDLEGDGTGRRPLGAIHGGTGTELGLPVGGIGMILRERVENCEGSVEEEGF